ncbi:MAG: dihydroorotase [Deltaproteobacteria bacterium]|nr:dihydroorotase [Deltaproteobacteria bacterium]
MAILIKGGKILDPAKGTVEENNIIIDDGVIERILPPGDFGNDYGELEHVDAYGKIIIPGLIDMHTHLREPGYEYKETIATGANAGMAGGFTSLACMPNTNPVNDNSAVTKYILDQAGKLNNIKIYPIAAITRGQKGKRLTDFSDLSRAGSVGVSDDGFHVEDEDIMLQAIKLAARNNLAIISHCETTALSKGGVMLKGYVSDKMGLKGIPPESEETAVKRDLALAKLAHCPVHIAHVSTKGSVEAIRRAKDEGVLVTAETAPHYFSLDHTAVEVYNTNAKMNPPLAMAEDVEAVKKGLREGVLDVIATDHAPHSIGEKDQDFNKAPFGIIGLETALPLSLALVEQGVLTLPGVIGKMTCSPARILGIEGGTIEIGRPADLAIIDLECEYELQAEDLRSKSRNSPFIGRRMKGRNTVTIAGGRIVWKRDEQHISSR